MTFHYILLAALTIGCIGDIWTTLRFVKEGGVEREGNPHARWLMQKIGLRPAMILGKGITYTVGWWILYSYPYVPGVEMAAILMVMGQIFAIVWNLSNAD